MIRPVDVSRSRIKHTLKKKTSFVRAITPEAQQATSPIGAGPRAGTRAHDSSPLGGLRCGGFIRRRTGLTLEKNARRGAMFGGGVGPRPPARRVLRPRPLQVTTTSS